MTQITERDRRVGGRAGPDEAVLDDVRGGAHAGTVLRVPGALAVLTVGAVHLEQYFGVHFNVVPIIGPLFVLNFAGAALIALGLLLPLGRLHIPLALGGIGLAATAFVFFLISEHRQLFGFHDYGYRPAIIVALASEAAAVALLGGYLVSRARTS